VLQFFIFCLELFTLYIFSQHISKQTSQFFYRIFKNQRASGILLSVLFLPGTFIHELAHYLMAVIVRVRATHFTLLPKIGTESIIMGSVGIEKPDLFRNFLIGIAPFISGTTIILGGIYFFNSLTIPIFSFPFFVCSYGLFTISNTMFSSKKDLEGTAELLIILTFLIAIFYFLGFRIPHLTFESNFLNLIKQANKLLLVPLGIDILFLTIIRLLNYTLRFS
jgi:hypothetical protein